MRFYEIYEANMGQKTLRGTQPSWDNFTAGFEIEIAVDESVIDDFDYEEYYSMQGEPDALDKDVIRDEIFENVMEGYDPTDFFDLQDYYSKDGIPDGYREATEEEIKKLRSEDDSYDSDDWIFIVDEDDDEIIGVDFTDISEIKNWMPDIHELIYDEYLEKIDEIIDEQVERRIKDLKEEVPTEFIINETVNSAMYEFISGYDVVIHDGYHSDEKSGVEYVIEPDQTIEPMGTEVVSPVFHDYEEFSEHLEDALQMIDNTYEFYTNNSTGLHINIGGFNPDNLDMTKLIVFLGEAKVASAFDRELVVMAQQIIPKLSRELSNLKPDLSNYKDLKPKLDDFINKKLLKYYSINFEKMSQGYIEFRSLGGENYEDKLEEIQSSIQRMIRAINISLDPNAYKNEYFKKLAKISQDETFIPKKPGETRTPALVDAIKYIRKYSPFTHQENIKSHEDFAFEVVNDQIRRYSKDDKPSEIYLNMKTRKELVDIYYRLKQDNLKSFGNGLWQVRKTIEDESEKFDPKVRDFLLKLFS